MKGEETREKNTLYTVGIAGMAKNTGKTTATKALLEEAMKYQVSLAVTSIGYDGEDLDQVTLLPKPRISLPEGAFVITAESCFEQSEASLQPLKTLEGRTSLGPLILARVTSPGLILLAGPRSRKDLREAISAVKELSVDLFLVDGALNRLSPLFLCDAFILSTGAARNRQISQLRDESKALLYLLQLPQSHGMEEQSYVQDEKGKQPLTFDSLLSPAMVEEVLRETQGSLKSLCLQGTLSMTAWKHLLEKKGGCRLILPGPTSLLVAGGPLEIFNLLQAWEQEGGRLEWRQTLPLKAITINPFYPRYSPRGHHYQGAYVHGDVLRAAFEDFPIPVVDVLAQGSQALWEAAVPGMKDLTNCRASD